MNTTPSPVFALVGCCFSLYVVCQLLPSYVYTFLVNAVALYSVLGVTMGWERTRSLFMHVYGATAVIGLSAVVVNALVPAETRVAYANALCFNISVEPGSHDDALTHFQYVIVRNAATLFAFTSNLLSVAMRAVTFGFVSPPLINHSCPR